MAATEYIYYKKNVPYNVGVRFHIRDSEGMVLTNSNPYVNVDKDKHREFLQTNRYAIEKGLIKEADEPSFDIVPENTLSDEEARELVKNAFILKKKLPTITSEAILYKLYDEAKAQNRAKGIIKLIEERLLDITPAGMQGVEWSERGSEDLQP